MLGVMGKLIDNMAPAAQRFADVGAQLLQKPSYDFVRFSPELKDSVMRVFRHDAAARSHYADFKGTLDKMRMLGFYDDNSDTWRHGYHILDTIPAEVLLNVNANGWNGNVLAAKSKQWIRKQKELGTASKIAQDFDIRYLDESRIDPFKLQTAINYLTPLQKESLAELSHKLYNTRQLALSSQVAQLDALDSLGETLAKKTGKPFTKLSDEERLAKIKENLGPTVSSYIPHFLYDMYRDNAMTPHLWKLAGDVGDLSDAGNQLSKLLMQMPDEKMLQQHGTSQVKWLSLNLHEILFKNKGEGISPEELESTAIRLLDHRSRAGALANDGQALTREFSPEVFVKYYKRRVDELVTSGVYNPFSRLENYILPTLRKTYLEPVITQTRVHGAWLEELNPEAYGRMNNWLNVLVGERSNHGIEYLLHKNPVISRSVSAVNKATTALVYTKLLWANTSSALLNLTQPFQFGLGKHGFWATSAAAKMMLDKEEYGHVLDALTRSSLVESSMSAILGGNSLTNSVSGLDATFKGVPTQTMESVGNMLRNLKMAATPEEARRLVLPFVDGHGFSPGAIGQTLQLAGSFMTMAEMAVRQFTTTAGAFKSALDQVLDSVPGAQIIGQGSDIKVVDPRGNVIDIFEELKKAAPQAGSERDIFHTHNAGGLVSWDRVLNDASALNADVNFVMSSANYSQLERYVRELPVIGPATATFTNYSMHVALRLATDVTTLVRHAAVKGGFQPKIPIKQGEALEAFQRLYRYAGGTFLIGGPFAFSPMIDTALKISSAVDKEIPNSIDDPSVRGVLHSIEQASLGGLPTAFGMPGIDFSSRVGPQMPIGFITGGRFSDNPMANWVSDIHKGFLAGKKVDPTEQARARYDVLGSFAGFFDNREYGTNPFGKSNPFVPIMIHNMAQMAIDLHDAAKGVPLKDELGRVLELPPPTEEIIARGFIGRTTYTREKMKRIAEVRPAMMAKIRDIRSQFVDAFMRKDYKAMRDLNGEMHKLNPLNTEEGDSLLHPDLAMDAGDLHSWKLRHMEPLEVRQMIQSRAVANNDAQRALQYLTQAGYTKNGKLDPEAVRASNDPEAHAMLTILEAVVNR